MTRPYYIKNGVLLLCARKYHSIHATRLSRARVAAPLYGTRAVPDRYVIDARCGITPVYAVALLSCLRARKATIDNIFALPASTSYMLLLPLSLSEKSFKTSDDYARLHVFLATDMATD